MYITDGIKRILMLGGVAVLALIALIAYSHHETVSASAEPTYANPSAGVNAEPVSRDLNDDNPAANPSDGRDAYGQPVGYTNTAATSRVSSSYSGNSAVVCSPSPFGSSESSVASAYSSPAPTPVQPQYGYAAPPVASQAYYAPAGYMTTRVVAQAPVRHYYYTPRRHRYVVVTKRRKFSHSAAIVGGSAGAGAIIGALAGGGKGAGIGALVGGGGGLVYDRLTHKKRVVVQR